MSKTVYSVAGPSLDNKYGIAAVNRSENCCAVTMPFLQDRNDAEHLAAVLISKQVGISDFCDAFLEGRLMDIE